MHSLSVRRKDSNFSFMGKKFCIYPLTTLNVTVPHLTPCCFSMLSRRISPTLVINPDTPFDRVWNSASWTWWRKHIAADEYNYCEQCSQKSDFVTEEELRSLYPDIADEIMQYKNGDYSNLSAPSTMVLSFDHTCNLRCVTCRPSDRQVVKWDYVRLPQSVMEYVNKVKRVVIAGDGEVAVSPSYRKLLAAVGKDTKVTLMSNGTLLNMDFWGSLDEHVLRQIDRVHISCDGTTKEVYESIRLNGNFDKWIENMSILMGLKSQYGWTTKMMYTVSKKNYADFRNVGKFAHGIGFDELYVGLAAEWSRATPSGTWRTDQVLGDYERRLAGIVAKQIMSEYMPK